jgi:uncharacterized membrane protein (DUF4010 family)
LDDHLELVRSLAIAILTGALIGLEREYHHRLKHETGFAGLRTFTFFAVLGNLSTWIATLGHPWILPVGFLGLVLLLGVSHLRSAVPERDRGMTTEVASLITFLIGVLTALGRVEVAVALAVVVAALLSAKPAFRNWVEQLEPEDIYTTLKFAVVAFVVFPILPDRSYGPLAALNPHEIWIMVVLISGVSFLGYIALKLLGPDRGIALSGLLGGLASSTAVAVSFSRRSREQPELVAGCALAVVIASTVMVVRIAALVAAVDPSLFRLLWMPLAAIGITGVACAAVLRGKARHQGGTGAGLKVRNPFRLTTVLAFGAAYAIVLFLVKAGQASLPAGSTAAVAALSGLTQVDAITLSVAKLAREGMAEGAAAVFIVVGALSNTASKAVIAGVLGHRDLRLPVLMSLGIMFAAGLATVPWILR